MKYSNTWYLLLILLITINTTDIFSQTLESPSFMKGDIVTSFNLGYIGAERDTIANIEFEQSFKRLSLNLQAFIFITKNFGLGLEIGKQNLERKYVYDNFGEVVTSYQDDNFLIYSIYAGYYTPLALFGGDTIGYIEGGVLRFQDEVWFFKGDYYGYKLSAGVLLPINKHTFLNVKLQQFSYQFENRYGNNNIKWPINFSLNVGVSENYNIVEFTERREIPVNSAVWLAVKSMAKYLSNCLNLASESFERLYYLFFIE